MQYDLRHPKCGAKWQAVYEKFPDEVLCIKCDTLVQSRYDPLITVVTPKGVAPLDLGYRGSKRK